jgi:hypothetical protein
LNVTVDVVDKKRASGVDYFDEGEIVVQLFI